MKFDREFAMPSATTFSIAPIGRWVLRWTQLFARHTSIDPFARDSRLCTYTNDINPKTRALYHMDAEKFLLQMRQDGVAAHLAIFDPPYSPRQISECYKGCGLPVTAKDTQNAALYRRVRNALDPLIVPGGIVLSFGWSSNGMGKTRGYEIEEMLLVAHGGAHNDTICIAERKCAMPSQNQTEDGR